HTRSVRDWSSDVCSSDLIIDQHGLTGTWSAIVEDPSDFVGEVERFPEIGRIFYDRGPGAGQAVLIDYITAQVRAGNLSADDPREVGRSSRRVSMSIWRRA